VSTADVASAQNAQNAVISCNGGRCEGTEGRDIMVDSNNPGQLFGLGGDDDIELDAVFASGSADVGDGGEGRDCIDGGGGGDLMIGGPGDDTMNGIFDNDTLIGGTGDDLLRDPSPGDRDDVFVNCERVPRFW
jgi:Ca2+-binding RTX toxin-like protein